MARCGHATFGFTLLGPLLVVISLSGCGIQIQSLAQSPATPGAPVTSFGSPVSGSQIFLPCVAGNAPDARAASTISELLLGTDRFQDECAHHHDVTPLFDNVAGRDAAAPTVSAPAALPVPDVLVTDELVGAVLTGTSEYWYQPVIGPA